MEQNQNWQTLYKKESYGNYSFGVEIRVMVDRSLNENDRIASYTLGENVEDVIMRETVRLDPKEQKTKEEERIKLLQCFNGLDIYAEELPNGYCNRWCCEMRPWYKVTSKYGVITIGWRKRVIQISWEKNVNDEAETLFPDEKSTRFDRTIHAWGYEKAQEYLTRLITS